MKIATFNVNGINRRLDNLLDWLNASKPDVVCLQELKATDGQFPKTAIEAAGYGAVWRGQSGWNGVAILARDGEPIMTRAELPGDPSDTQGRYIEAAVNGILIASLYAPNGNPQPGPKFDYKLAWHDRLALMPRSCLRRACRSSLPAITTSFRNRGTSIPPGLTTTTRSSSPRAAPRSGAFSIRAGSMRSVKSIPRDAIYTFWDYRRNRWERDAGLRLDHILLSRKLKRRLGGAGVDRDARGLEGASDHAPAWITLAN